MKIKKTILQSILVILTLTMVGCAGTRTPNPQDPYQGYNRAAFAFNRTVDKYAIRPVAKTYDFILPSPVKTGVGNVFSNLNEIPTIGNDILQGQVGWAIADIWRLAINSTVGLGGLIDVATPFGLKKRHQDLGLTFAKWGAKKSPYFVIPFVGPSTVRDGVALFANYELMTVYPRIDPLALRWSILAGYYIHLRAELLPTDDLINEAFDPYVFVRNAYLQRRAYLIAQNEGITTSSDNANEEEDPYVDMGSGLEDEL